MFQRILVPLDGSSRAEQALPIAARIARASNGSVLLVHVVDNATNVWASHIDSPLLLQTFLEVGGADAEAYLKNLTTATVFAGIATETCVPFGSAASTLLSVASSSHADLIVLCSHGYTRVTRWILGGVAEYVIRHASLPILLLREGNVPLAEQRSDVAHALRTLVTLDGSVSAEEALLPAAFLVTALSPSTHKELHLLRVVKPETSDSTRDLVDTAQRYLSVTAKHTWKEVTASSTTSYPLVITHSVAVDSEVADAIVATAEWAGSAKDEQVSDGYDVIVMATSGHKGVQWWTMGSITENVLNKTTLPLLIIRSSTDNNQNGA